MRAGRAAVLDVAQRAQELDALRLLDRRDFDANAARTLDRFEVVVGIRRVDRRAFFQPLPGVLAEFMPQEPGLELGELHGCPVILFQIVTPAAPTAAPNALRMNMTPARNP